MSPRLLDTLMLLSVATVTWLTVRIDSVVSLTYSDILIAAFLAAFALDRLALRDGRLHPAALSAAGFMLVFLAVYLCGYFDLSVHQATTYWVKGVIDWMLHACFLVAVIAHLARRGRPLYERTISWFVWGIVICAVYGLVQLIVQIGAGINLDNIVVKGITLGLSNPNGINVYGQVGGTANIYRINALTGDPDHMGVMLCVPLLMLFPYWLAAPRERLRVGLVLAFLFAIQVLTLSRSAALGDIVGLLVLFPLIRPYLPRLRTIVVMIVNPVVGRDAAYVGDAVGVLKLCDVGSDEHVKCFAMSLGVIAPVCLDRIPELRQAFFVGVAVLHDESGHAIGMLQRKPPSDGSAVVHHVHREARDLKLAEQTVNQLAEAVEGVGELGVVRHIALVRSRDSRARSRDTDPPAQGSGCGTCATKSGSHAAAGRRARRRDRPRDRRYSLHRPWSCGDE